MLGWQYPYFHPIGLRNKFVSISQVTVVLYHLTFHLFFVKLCCSTMEFLSALLYIRDLKLFLTCQLLLEELNLRLLCEVSWLELLSAPLNKTLSLIFRLTLKLLKNLFPASNSFSSFFKKSLWLSNQVRMLSPQMPLQIGWFPTFI